MVKRANKRTNRRRTKRAQKNISSKFKTIIESIDVSECVELYRKYQGSASSKKQKSRSQKGGSHEDMGTTEICLAILIVVMCARHIRDSERFRHFLEFVLSISGLD